MTCVDKHNHKATYISVASKEQSIVCCYLQERPQPYSSVVAQTGALEQCNPTPALFNQLTGLSESDMLAHAACRLTLQFGLWLQSHANYGHSCSMLVLQRHSLCVLLFCLKSLQ